MCVLSGPELLFNSDQITSSLKRTCFAGDREYKPFVSSECDIKSLEIEGDEDFLILACDGLWDTLSPEAAVNLVYAYLTRNDGKSLCCIQVWSYSVSFSAWLLIFLPYLSPILSSLPFKTCFSVIALVYDKVMII